jgi:NitT/TauT family transport system permease protein
LALGSIIPGLLVLAWWYGVKKATAVVPYFSEVWDVLSHPFREPPDLNSRSLAFSTFITLVRLVVGFGVGVITAVPMGYLSAKNRIVHRLVDPVVQMAKPINPIILLPIATVLFGLTSFASILYGELQAWRHDVLDQVQIAMVIILWWGAFFPVYISTFNATGSIKRSYIETMVLLQAGRWHLFRYVELPYILPQILNGMRIALGVTWLVLIAAEIFPGTRAGLGYMLCTACKTSDYQYTFSALIIIAFVGLITDRLLYYLETRTSHWRAAER